MIARTLEAHVAADVHGRALATLGDNVGVGLGAELHAQDAHRLARLFEKLAFELEELPLPDPKLYGPRGRPVTLTDAGEIA